MDIIILRKFKYLIKNINLVSCLIGVLDDKISLMAVVRRGNPMEKSHEISDVSLVLTSKVINMADLAVIWLQRGPTRIYARYTSSR